jgi:hypothetical protein
MKSAMSAFALILAASTVAFAGSLDTSDEALKHKGSYSRDYSTGAVSTFAPRAQEDDVVVFNNLTSSAVTGFTRANSELPTYGAALNLAQGGRLQEIYFSIFNSNTGGNTGSITGGAMTIRIYDNTTPYTGSGPITNPLLGTITGTLDYTADPLPTGFYLTDGFVGLNSLNIVMPSNILVTQTLVPTGTSTRNGYVSFAPDIVGSSDGMVYLSSTQLAAGYYNLGTAPNFVDATPGYFIVVPEPTSLATLALGGLILRRRRA